MRAFVDKTPITKGWSGDKKYCVTDERGTKYLLRISPAESFERRRKQFCMMCRVFSVGVSMCEPVECGMCSEGVYVLHGWIDGVDAEQYISTLPKKEQYAYGICAGKELKTIHTIPAPDTVEPWAARFNKKIDRKIQLYTDCPIKCENGQLFIDYLNENRCYLSDREQCYQHGDFHIGNMMIDKRGRLVIIDFDRDDFGDPWEEFNRIVWCAGISPAFASGMVDGYFDNDVPMLFWRLLAVYISSNMLSSVPWATQFDDEQINIMLNQASEVLSWYDNMRCAVPSWYHSV